MWREIVYAHPLLIVPSLLASPLRGAWLFAYAKTFHEFIKLMASLSATFQRGSLVRWHVINNLDYNNIGEEVVHPLLVSPVPSSPSAVCTSSSTKNTAQGNLQFVTRGARQSEWHELTIKGVTIPWHGPKWVTHVEDQRQADKRSWRSKKRRRRRRSRTDSTFIKWEDLDTVQSQEGISSRIIRCSR